ncbi:putative lipid-transfer protein DIR1 [Sesamum alatum]|uniref:Lipid-transfer protein DIR1 n=1 Tax=Sesamum alatum TaxID=300844 RepID=A0AAE1Y6K7_9LAMI|nr:putative lipid-transfer protein DIR1 [Sesamum alatum]
MEASATQSRIATRALIVALVVIVSAAVSATAKANDGLCGMSQDELVECRPAVATGSATPPPPSSACCAALGHANLTCFCGFKNNKYLPLFGINSTRAMELPSKCDPNQTAHC